MKITRENYEPFFLDYLEGNLDKLLVDDFIEFLQQNPDLKEELQLFEAVTIPTDKLEFAAKDKLYRNVYDQPEIFVQTAIAWLEGDLEEQEAAKFMAYIEKNPKSKSELKRFEATRLVPDLSVTFAKKEKLYHQPVIRPILFWAMRVAAVLLIALALWNLWPSDTAEIINQPVISELQPDNIVPENPVSTENSVINQHDPEKGLTPINSGQAKSMIIHKIKPSSGVSKIALAENYQRIEISVPDLLPVKKVNFEVAVNEPLLAFATQPVDYDVEPDFYEQEYLTDKLREKMGLEGFTFAKLMRSGLELASNLSNERVSYDTNNEGEIVALSLNTNLLGFRIPVGRK
jgi:hypothetical protein